MPYRIYIFFKITPAALWITGAQSDNCEINQKLSEVIWMTADGGFDYSNRSKER